MAKKSSGPTKKKASSKPKGKTSKKSGRAASSRKNRGTHPVYALVIMALLAALAIMVNRFYEKPAGHKDHAVTEKHRTVTEKSSDKQKIPENRNDNRTKKVSESVTDKPDKVDTKITKEQPAQENIKVFFIKINEQTDKTYLAPATRAVDKRAVFENTIRELIKGPSAAEKKKGLLTAVPPELRLNSARVKNKTAELDFNGAIEKDAGGSILINRIDQIVYTATQFPTVASVVIKINGKKRETLGSDGLSIGGPLHRRRQ